MREHEKTFLLAVNGTLMRGLELEHNMIENGASFESEARTASCYRLWSINDAYPGMIRVDSEDPGAAKIDVEVWRVPASGLAHILAGEPPGLAIGKIELEDGRFVFGVLAEPLTVKGMREITSFGGWRRYMDEKED
ncbi:MAG TPA: gamma-glutamylcyclotransferase [Bacillota bacterium]|nr:gamma-glutamylcyclotransferase [Bacillota bacterium]HQC49003.1 gamma-glutamylcyclotransferase [Bacillota bacterium]